MLSKCQGNWLLVTGLYTASGQTDVICQTMWESPDHSLSDAVSFMAA